MTHLSDGIPHTWEEEPLDEVEPSPAGFSLSGLINKHLADKQEEKEYTSWRASSLGKCPREAYYLRLGVTPPADDERKLKVFEVGNLLHEWVQGIATDHGYAQYVEHELYDNELDLGGRCDLVVWDGDKRILFDIKTVHPNAFWHMEKNSLPLKDKYPHYYKQLGGYMLLLKKAGLEVDEGRILVISKGDMTVKEVSYQLTPELEQSVIDEVTYLNECLRTKTLPKCICQDLFLDKNGKSSGPKYCKYKGEGGTCCDPNLLAPQKEPITA